MSWSLCSYQPPAHRWVRLDEPEKFKQSDFGCGRTVLVKIRHLKVGVVHLASWPDLIQKRNTVTKTAQVLLFLVVDTTRSAWYAFPHIPQWVWSEILPYPSLLACAMDAVPSGSSSNSRKSSDKSPPPQSSLEPNPPGLMGMTAISWTITHCRNQQTVTPQRWSSEWIERRLVANCPERSGA